MRYTILLPFCLVSILYPQENINLDSIDSLLLLGSTAHAESLLSKINDPEADSVRIAYLRSLISIQKSDYNSAINNLEDILEIDSENPDYYFLLANVYALKVQDSFLFISFFARRKMLQCLEKVLKLDPDFAQARYILFQYHLNAPFILGGNLDRAKTLAAELLVSDPSLSHYLLALYWEEMENEENIEKELKLSIYGNPTNVDALNRLGYFYLRQKTPNKGYKYFQQAIMAAPETANVYDSMGDYHATVAQYDSALYFYEQALSKDPDFTVSLFNKARMHEVLNQNEDALSAYKLLRDNYLDDRYGKQARQRFNELE